MRGQTPDTGDAMGDANVEGLWQWGRGWRTGSGGGVIVDSATSEVELEQFDPDVVYEDTTLPDHAGESYRGRDGVARAIERWSEPYKELTVDLEQVFGSGDCLVSIRRVRARAAHRARVRAATRLSVEIPRRQGRLLPKPSRSRGGARAGWSQRDRADELRPSGLAASLDQKRMNSRSWPMPTSSARRQPRGASGTKLA